MGVRDLFSVNGTAGRGPHTMGQAWHLPEEKHHRGVGAVNAKGCPDCQAGDQNQEQAAK